MKEMTRVELRRLEMRDLNAIERIERASYPTPWSRSMFASELAKPSSICLGAFDLETLQLVGYLVISRYVDAWHVMNVAVAAEHRRRGIATMLLERLFEATAGRGGAATRSRCESRTRGGRPLRAPRLQAPRRQARVLHRQPRGRADHVEGPDQRAGRLILGIETSCDETAAAVVTQDGQDPVERCLLAGGAACALRRRRPGRSPRAAILELVVPVLREALAEADRKLDDLDAVAVTQGPGLVGALLVGLSAAKAVAVGEPAAADPGQPSPRSCRLALPAARAGRAAVSLLLASGGHTLLIDVPEHGAFRVLGTTLDDAAGEAFDKGARLLGLGYPGGSAIDRLAGEGRIRCVRLPRRTRARRSTSPSPA
jgi:GNAT superfamily N-acetyltransferase